MMAQPDFMGLTSPPGGGDQVMREVFQTQLPVVFGLRFTYAFATTIVVMAHYYFPR